MRDPDWFYEGVFLYDCGCDGYDCPVNYFYRVKATKQ